MEFSGIREFIDEPLRTYSTGMVMRLAFSVAINRDPEILLIDEVLAVGDAAFQAKCFERIHEFRNAGKTLLCVSHTPMIRAVMRPGHLAGSWRVDPERRGGATSWRHMRGGRPHPRNVRTAWPETAHSYVGQSRNLQELLRRADSPPSRQELLALAGFLEETLARIEAGEKQAVRHYAELERRLLDIENSRFLRTCSGPAGSWGTGRGAWANCSCIPLFTRSI